MLVKKELLALPIPPVPEELRKKKKPGYLAMVERYDDILSVTVYEIPQKTVKVRYFTDGVNSIKHKNGKWETAKMGTLIYGTSAYYSSISPGYHDQQSEAIAKGYFDDTKIYTQWGNALTWCDKWDERIAREKRERAWQSEIDRMNAHFEAFPPHPTDLGAFVDKKLPQYLFYSKIEKGKRRVRCSACGRTYTVGKGVPKHKKVSVCRRCRTEATWRATWLGQPKMDELRVWLLQRKGNDLYWRIVDVLREFCGDEHTKKYHNCDQRRMFETVENGKRRVYNYGLVNVAYYGWHWKRFRFGEVYEKDGWIYPDTISEALGDTFHHVDTRSIANIPHEADLFYLITALREKRTGEYFAKAGMWRLLQHQARMAYDVEVPQHLRRLARKYDISIYEMNALEKTGIVSDERFEAVRRTRGGKFGSPDMIQQIGIDRFIHYFGRWYQQQPKAMFSQVEQWYKDYLRMCAELKVDLSNKSVRFPRDLKEEHDRLAKRISELKRADENKYFAERVKELYKDMRGYTTDKYTVVFPQLRTDLIAEGQSLNHCVGGQSYSDYHLAGEKMIFFIRAVENPEKPLYTLQADVRKGTILQLYGYGDKPAPAAARLFCEKFLAQLWVEQVQQATA